MPTNASHISQFFIQVDGTDLSPEVMGRLDDAVVEDDLAQSAMFALRFHDPQFVLIDGEQFRLGREITIGAAGPGGQRKSILTGEVTTLEPQIEQTSPVLVVQGYDYAHRLHRGRKTRTFLRQSDSDIATSIAREAGLRIDAEPTSEQIAYIIQDNQTDMEFLRARAARIGYRVVVEGRKLVFRRFEGTPLAAPALEWGNSLRSFRVRMTAVAQPSEVQVRGWDPQAKRAIVGKATTPAQPTKIKVEGNGGAAAAKAFGAPATITVTDQPVRTRDEADRLAQAVLDDVAGEYLRAEGVCAGEPTLRAGTQVAITGVGKRLEGTYFVSASRHEYKPEGYTTTFSINGRHPRSLLSAITGDRVRPAIEGVVVGIVTNVNDPDGLGRVKVTFPWLDDSHESNWARLAMPGAGKDRGFLSMPEVDDEVLVAFEHGDISQPYVLGGLWNGKDRPPAAAVQNGKVHVRTIKTRAGHTITLQDDDSSGGGLIVLRTKGGQEIRISDNDTKVSIASQGDVEIKGPGGKLSITSAGVELVSKSSLKVQANATLDVKAERRSDHPRQFGEDQLAALGPRIPTRRVGMPPSSPCRRPARMPCILGACSPRWRPAVASWRANRTDRGPASRSGRHAGDVRRRAGHGYQRQRHRADRRPTCRPYGRRNRPRGHDHGRPSNRTDRGIRMAQRGDLIGSGWQFPLAINGRGGIALARGEDEIAEAIAIILSTPLGYRVMRPTFGCRIHELLFAPINASTTTAASHYVADALGMWEPRIDVGAIDVVADPQQPSCLLISLSYSIRATHDERSLVYPFYTIPGEDAA